MAASLGTKIFRSLKHVIVSKLITHPKVPESIGTYLLNRIDFPVCMGSYDDFQALADQCTTYVCDEAVDSLKKNYKNLEKRDSFELTYNLEIITCFGIAQSQFSALTVLDIGGGIGIDFHTCCHHFGEHTIKNWYVSELKQKVEVLSGLPKTEKLHFISDIKNVASSVDVVFISGTLQYTSAPLELLQSVFELDPEYILITKTPYWGRPTRLSKQLSWMDEGYSERQTYPFWILNEEEVMNIYGTKYKKIMDMANRSMPVTKHGAVQYRSILFKKS